MCFTNPLVQRVESMVITENENQSRSERGPSECAEPNEPLASHGDSAEFVGHESDQDQNKCRVGGKRLEAGVEFTSI